MSKKFVSVHEISLTSGRDHFSRLLLHLRYDEFVISSRFQKSLISTSETKINDVIFDEEDFDDFCIHRVEISESIFYIDVLIFSKWFPQDHYVSFSYERNLVYE